jgi:iron complex outermembrane recepter protein
MLNEPMGRTLVRCCMAIALLAASLSSRALDLDTTIQINIVAESLESALLDLAQQASIQVVLDAATLKDKQGAALAGQMRVRDALDRLLHDSGLGYRWSGTKTVIIVTDASAQHGSARDASGDAPLAFNIAAGPLDLALTIFAAQGDVKVTAAPSVTAGKKGKAVKGTLAPADALRRLLKGSGLTFVRGSNGDVTIQAIAAIGATAVDTEGPVAADVSVQSKRVVQVYAPGGNIDIPRTIDDVQPYYVFDSETIEQSGAVNLEDFLKQRLTMNTESRSNSQNISTGGPLDTRSAINLRGLGADHTLILVDGRRMPGVSLNGDGANTQPDINGIPLAAIDRIEVLPSSASGIYGGNAVGGVINIILKKNYKGGDISVNYGKPESSTSSSRSIDGNYGFSLEGGKTHVMLAADYSDESPMTTGDREGLIERGLSAYTSKCPNGSCLPGAAAGAAFPGGGDVNLVGFNYMTGLPENLVLANGTVLPFSVAHIAPGCIATKPLISCLQPGQDSTLAPGAGPYGLDQQLGAFSHVFSVSGDVSREMLPWLTAFASVRLNEDVSESNHLGIAQQGYPWGPNPYFQVTNPGSYVDVSFPSELLPASQDRSDSSTRTATFGLQGNLPHNWNVEADYTWSKNVYDARYDTQDSLKPIIDWGVGASNSINFAASSTPGFPLLPPPPGTTSSWLDPVFSNNSTTVNDLALRGTGPVGHLPWGDPTMAFGLDVERDAIPEAIFFQDPTTATAAEAQAFYDAIGCPACYSPYALTARNPTIYFPQTQTAASLYAEANIPLITERNAIPAVQALALQLTDRVEHYTVFTGTSSESINEDAAQPIISYGPTPANADSNGNGGTPTRTETSYRSNNKTLGLKWNPVKDVMIRGSVATAFLPPTYGQLLPSTQVCVGCAYIPTGGYFVNSLNGGNPNLQPQTSRSVDAGVIYEPRDGVLRGLRIDLEYYNIRQFNAIVYPAVTDILGNPGLASRVTRNAQGLITQVNLSALNAPELKTEGNDLSISYHAPIRAGVLDVRVAGTIIKDEDRQLCITCQFLDYAGWYGEDKYKANGSVQYSWHGWRVGWTTTWYGRTGVEGAPGDPNGTNIGPGTLTYYQGSYYYPAQSYSDLLIGYAWDNHAGALLSNTKAQLVVNNVLNQVPPLDVTNAPFFYSTLGDIRLRTFQVLFKKSF